MDPALDDDDAHSDYEDASSQQDVPSPVTVTAAENMEVSDNSAVGKIRAIFGMLTKFIGVKDIVNLRVSLPANLLDPVSNLEAWNYMDRPDTFLEMADPDDPVDRMLKVVKYWFAKDARFTNNRIAKPYNSILGEQFLCHCDVDMNNSNNNNNSSTSAPVTNLLQAYPSPDSSSSAKTNERGATPQPVITSVDPPAPGCLRVHCITEQISHHPPVSAYYYYSPDKRIVCRGVDHVCAKFTGTCMKVFPGPMNRGIYITMQSRDNEEYLCTHPTAYINGWLKASLYLTIGEHCVISCPKTRLRTVLEYKDESFFGSAKYLVHGKIYRYDPDAALAEDGKKIVFNKIPESDVVCNISGCWRGAITYQKTALASKLSSEQTSTQTVYPATDKPALLIDMTPLQPLTKIVAPLDMQSPQESRRIWHDVTQAILDGRFDDATKAKRQLEDNQRAKTAERKASMEHHHSHWFQFGPDNDKTLLDACVQQRDMYEYEGPPARGSTAAVMSLGKPYLRMDRRDALPWLKPA